MGITNLLRELQPITKTVDLSYFRGQTCAVDASCWLHRASSSCAVDLVLGKPTTKYLNFTLKCIKLLQTNGITPIIVFDGGALPMKASEEQERNNSRETSKQLTLKYLQSGEKDLAYKAARSAIRITKQMVTGFMNQCNEYNVRFICAPYEADAQLGYLYRTKRIDFAISEDSDLFLFGVNKVLCKLDINKTNGQLVNMNEISVLKQNLNISSKKKKNDLCLFLQQYWHKEEGARDFIIVCVLSGCDYVDNLTGIGLKTAVKYCNKNRNINSLLDSVLNDKGANAPKNYRIQFKRAVLTFLHQRVYDIAEQKLVHLTPLAECVEEYRTAYNDTSLDFLGKDMDDCMATAIAQGTIGARDRQPRNLQKTQEIADINENMNNMNLFAEAKHNTNPRNQGLKQDKTTVSAPTSSIQSCFPHAYKCSSDSRILFCTKCGHYMLVQ